MENMAGISSVMKAVAWTCRWVLGGTFAYAAITKLADPPGFLRSINHYLLVSYPLAFVSSVFLPCLELVCGTAVILRWRERGALWLIFCLCVIFAFALGSAWWRGLDINCGCFGPPMKSSLAAGMVRDVVLGLIALFLLRAGGPARIPPPTPNPKV